jgi:hypothetical protein
MGEWVSRQRLIFKAGRMDQERKRMLDEIGFTFKPPTREKSAEENWNWQFKKLRDYYGKHGHCELLWAVDRFTFILNTPTDTPHVFLPALHLHCSATEEVQGRPNTG